MPNQLPSEPWVRPALGGSWALDAADLLRRLDSMAAGLSSRAAAERLRTLGRNELETGRRLSRGRVLLKQVQSPLLLMLVFAAAVSVLTGEWTDALITALSVIAAELLKRWFYRRASWW